MRKYRDIQGMKVNANRCKSCPFNDGGCLSIREKVEQRCLTEASQLCHGTHDTTLCRGARDFQTQVFHRLGVLKEPTDKCWEETLAKVRDSHEEAGQPSGVLRQKA